jgi:hypothetical protein
MRRFDEAIEAHQQAAAIFCELGDCHGEAEALRDLGTAMDMARRPGQAGIARAKAVEAFVAGGVSEAAEKMRAQLADRTDDA